MKIPKVSVIMSVYNGLPYLKEAIKSILNQTYRNFEFIIVDDASEDKTWEYLKNLKEERVKLMRNKKNLGLAASLNIALRQSQGDFIARMDADDISLPSRFEEQIKFLNKNSSIDLCGTWVDLVNDEGEIVGEKKFPVDDNNIKKALAWYSPIIHPTFMARKIFYKKMGGYDATFDYAEDYDLLLRARGKFKMTNIGQKLLLWRLGNKRRSRSEMNKIDKAELRIRIAEIKRNGISPKVLLALFKKIIFMYLMPSPVKIKIAKLLKLA
ncbi:MAG: WbfO protein [Candidatus Curtissbacteria bacterium GW2011_GWA1_40_47]|uniref:Glycosyltransferase 2-like domain-containing protein n=1 Tax=Candidatus Curtissbacteria bacterium RIFOXYA1_FULL_41_14 TaxID=1797737 RepID=A0A1F5HAX8_9BACT|nr:MAG: WbfO protein [Candidatus Curtissbacteria bacterium GW2011_GWB1_40_28]KKR62344.1 MAG: glycosyl transferase family 2 [Microgenomates group bacterium GW2011_GWC1_40_35]KKR66455.1 MAG: WbfO protein [Candidatus Curtissbacteria bacterium GW2011_GWA1_40_47]KKR77885.1 MAG: WbfO protein [Candidatus Curtissbacteria bacterium GW2011_GWD1_40_8]KKS02512.1 MAG: WbfO protein [Candidatus Curtissbacteria bacterium GW2011_GWC2_41_21]OGD79276.1 MAG: hypothetical protein A2683_04280 [Candidatus Curtissbac